MKKEVRIFSKIYSWKPLITRSTICWRSVLRVIVVLAKQFFWLCGDRWGLNSVYLRIAFGAWPPTTYITFGNPMGVLGRVLGDWTDERCSFVSKWYFMASIKKSLHMLLFLTNISVSTRLTRYSRDRRGSRTCSISWAKQSCRCSGSWFTHVTTASNTYKEIRDIKETFGRFFPLGTQALASEQKPKFDLIGCDF